jgi:DNA-binding transcriptional LysR family regulator
MDMDLRRFRYFLAVAEELNFGRAAARLHISQPPLSRQIRHLEDQLGVALFERDTHAVSLTAAGAAFVPEVRRTLDQAAKAVAQARQAGAAQGAPLVIGYTTVFDPSVFPDVLDELHRRCPGLQVKTRSKHSISLIRDLKTGSMDAAFIGLHTQAPGLSQIKIHEEPFWAALPRGHRLAGKKRVALMDLADDTLFWFERHLNPGFFDYCQAFFEEAKFRPRTLPEPLDHHVLLGRIAAGEGVGLVASSMRAMARKGVVYRALKDAPELSMGIALAYSTSNTRPGLQALVELMGARGNPAPRLARHAA